LHVGLRWCAGLSISRLARSVRHRRRRVVSSHVGLFLPVPNLILLLNQRAARAAEDLHAVRAPVPLKVVLFSDFGALHALQERPDDGEKAMHDARSVAEGEILQIAVTESVLGPSINNAR